MSSLPLRHGHDELRAFPQMRWVEEQLQPIDDRYRALLLDEQMRPKVPWWEWRYPRYAGQQWPAELLSLYGLTIEVRD